MAREQRSSLSWALGSDGLQLLCHREVARGVREFPSSRSSSLRLCSHLASQLACMAAPAYFLRSGRPDKCCQDAHCMAVSGRGIMKPCAPAASSLSLMASTCPHLEQTSVGCDRHSATATPRHRAPCCVLRILTRICVLHVLQSTQQMLSNSTAGSSAAPLSLDAGRSRHHRRSATTCPAPPVKKCFSDGFPHTLYALAESPLSG